MRYLRLCIIMIGAFLITSCSSHDDLLKLVPADATGVICINSSKIIEKAGLGETGNIKIPDYLQKSINQNDASLVSRLMTALPISGIDFTSNAYVFFSDAVFNTAVVANLDDAEKTQKWLEQDNTATFKEKDSYKYMLSGNTIYLIGDDKLFVGRFTSVTLDDAKIFSFARMVLENNSGKSFADNDEAKKALSEESDICAYIRPSTITKLAGLLVGSSNSTFAPLINIIAESDIKALTFSLTFNKDKADFKSSAIVGPNSQYVQLINTLAGKPSDEFLKIIPKSMDYIVSMSVNGNNLLKLKEVQKIIATMSLDPKMAAFDLKGAIASVNGPLAVAVYQDPNFNDQSNYVVAVKSSNPMSIITQINNYARHYGQAPQRDGNDYIYEYYNQQITVGTNGDYVYFKMLNFQPIDGFAYSDPQVRAFFKKSVMGIYANMRTQDAKTKFGEISMGSSSPTSSAGNYVPIDKKEPNSIQSFLQLLCSIKADAYSTTGDDSFLPPEK